MIVRLKTFSETHHIRHGLRGVSLYRLYTKESITKTPINPCTIFMDCLSTRLHEPEHEADAPAQLDPEAGMKDCRYPADRQGLW